jgi:D-inositol-3-phosphate glycosyltransferase
MVLNQMRIAMLSVHSCPTGPLGARDTGGMSVYIRELARELGKQGHSVDIFTRVHDLADPQIIDIGQNARLIHIRVGQEEAIPKLALYSYLPEFARNLENFRKNNGLHYDLVYSHYWLSGRAGKYLQHWWQVPHFITYHTLGAVKQAIGIGEDEPELRIVTERDSARNCHHIIVTTEKEKEELMVRYGASPGKISVIPCGVNLGLFQPVDKEIARQKLGFADEKIILFVGRIEPLKGVQQLLKAMPYLQDIQGIRLVIIGGDEYSQQEIGKLQKRSGDLHIQDSVTFRGLIKHEQMPYFYSAADACIIPSYYESFSMVALESLACGTPVVSTDVGDLKNIIRQGKTGYVIKDNSPRRLADKIALLLARPSDMKSALEIRASVSRFNWPNIAEAVSIEFRRVQANQLAPVS